MNKLFKNKNSFFGKIEAFCWKMYGKEPIRFLFWGAVNTVITYLMTLLLNFIFTKCGWPKLFFEGSDNEILTMIGNKFNIPFIIAFVIGIPIAYTTHALFSFHQEWKWVRLARYPLSSIPNFIIQLFFIWLFTIKVPLPDWIAFAIAAIGPLPIMFFINKFLVSPLKRSSKKKEVTKEDTIVNSVEKEQKK